MTKPVAWHLCSNRWNSAITEYALSLARCTSQLGFRTVMSGLPNSAANRRAEGYHLEVAPLSDFSLLGLPKFLSLASRLRPELVFVSGGPETVLTRFMASGKVMRFRGQAVDPKRTALSLRHRLAHGHVIHTLVPSPSLARQLDPLTKGGGGIRVLELGIDDQKFFYTSKPRRQPFEVVILGRLDPVKGHEPFIATFAAAQKKLSIPIKLHVVGEPANISVAHLEQVAKDNGLKVGEDITFTAERLSNLAEFLSTSTLGVIPSLDSEVICRVTQEFLLCGVPVLVSGVGSLGDCLYDGAGKSFAGLSDKARVKQLIEAIEQAASEPEEDRQFRAEKAKARFSLEAMAQNLRALLNELNVVNPTEA